MDAVADLGAVVATFARMRALGLSVGSLGNVSVRAGDQVWITPTRVLAPEIREEDLVRLDVNAQPPLDGRPSIESPLHLEVYRRHPRAAAIVHTHSPWATAWSYLGRDLDMSTEELRYHGLSHVPCSAAARAGSGELSRAAANALARADAALLRDHGVVALAASPVEALELCALVEQQAQIHWLLRKDGPGAVAGGPLRSD